MLYPAQRNIVKILVLLSTCGLIVCFTSEKLLILYTLKLIISCYFYYLGYSINTNYVRAVTPLLFFINIIALILVLLIGSVVLGCRRWIHIYKISIQPSEFSKLINILWTAYLMENKSQYVYSFLSVLSLGIVFLLITMQPDLGSAISACITPGIMIMLKGMNYKIFLFYLVSVLGAAVIFFKFLLHDYQRERFLSFLSGQTNNNNNYQVHQSLITIGYGGIFGNILNNKQLKSGFLPEYHTDFAFSSLCSNIGIFSTLILFYVLFLLIKSTFFCYKNVKNTFEKYCTIGILQFMIVSIIINVSMVVHLIPVVGVPMPIVSYGANAMLVIFFSMGMVSRIMYNAVN